MERYWSWSTYSVPPRPGVWVLFVFFAPNFDQPYLRHQPLIETCTHSVELVEVEPMWDWALGTVDIHGAVSTTVWKPGCRLLFANLILRQGKRRVQCVLKVAP